MLLLLAPLIGAALIAGGASVFGGLLGAGNSSRNMDKQHKYDVDMLNRSVIAQKDLFDYQFDANNSFNNPTAQMNRLKDAGLNPNLVYGNGGIAGITDTSMPGSVGASHVGLPPDTLSSSFTSAADAFLQAKQIQIQEKQLSNDTLRAYSDVENTNAKTLNEVLNYMRSLDKDTPEWKTANAMAQNLIASANKLDQETETEKRKTLVEDNNVKISELQIENTKTLGQKLATEIAEIQQKITESKSQTALNYATAELNRALASESRERKMQIREQTLSLRIQNDWADKLNSYQCDVLRATSEELGRKAESLAYDNWKKDFMNRLNQQGLFLSTQPWMQSIDQFVYNTYILFGGKPVK